MSHRCDNYRALILVEDYAPIPDPKPHTIASLQTLNIAMPGFGKLRQPLVDPTANIGR